MTLDRWFMQMLEVRCLPTKFEPIGKYKVTELVELVNKVNLPIEEMVKRKSKSNYMMNFIYIILIKSIKLNLTFNLFNF